MKPPRISLIHATEVAILPVRRAFQEYWPEATVVNLLEDGLTLDRKAEPVLTETMVGRILDLAFYARRTGADGIMFTCSAFGPAIEHAAAMLPIPVLKPNEAMFEAAFERGEHVGMVATFEPSIKLMEDEFAEAASRLSPKARLKTVLAHDALDLLKAGQPDRHNDLVARAAASLQDQDVIMLAHFSTAFAAPAVRLSSAVGVVTSPEPAVKKLRRLLEPADGGDAARPSRS